MSKYRLRDRTLALAGVFHGCALAHQIASSGQISEDQLGTAVATVLDTDAPDVESVYGAAHNLEAGLKALVGLRHAEHAYTSRYVIGIMTLERILKKRRDINDQLGEGIAKVAEQARYFGSNGHESVVGGLAELYKNQISPLGPRIMINGEAVYLENPRHAAEIRAMLLVALRSAVLWRQIGGTRLSLIFGYRKIVDEAKRLLA